MVVFRGSRVSTAVILVVLVVVVNHAAAGVRSSHQGPGRRNRAGILYGRSRDGDSSWAKCKEPVCQEVNRQAEGLLRLKHLRNYIVETMRIMDSLVTSVDAELVTQGAELSKFVGPLCTNSHEMMLNITTPSANANLDMGVGGPLSQDVDRFPTLDTEAQAVSKTSGRTGRRQFDQEGSESRIVETYGSSGSSSNKRRPSGSKHLNQVSPGTNQHGATGIVTREGIPSSSGGGGGGGYGGANSISDISYDRRGSSTGFGSGGGGRSISSDGGSGCRSVEPGSAHWVPGLDDWCATNCPTGYCPQTHCVCS